MKTYKHLTLRDRTIIQSGVSSGNSLSSIAKEIGKSVSTITKEIKKHLVVKKTNATFRHYNPCLYAKTCRTKNICDNHCKYICSTCGKCIDHCPKFVYYECAKLNHAPYCCNGCKSKCVCSLLKKYYYADSAELEYRQQLVETRKGYCITQEEAEEINSYFKPLIDKGQSIHHIVSIHKDELSFCEKTLYTYIDGGVFDLKNIDLPRKVRYKQRKKPEEHKIDVGCRIGRTYENYLEFMHDNDNPLVVQMDSVKGSQSGKVLLTIHFVSCSFMLAYIRESNTAISVIDIFNKLYMLLGRELFKRLFPVILTDNGTEFSNPIEIEFEPEYGERRTNIFYCDAKHSEQKGSIEVNHEFIRRISPKGKSFDDKTQEDINLMMSHINSYKRKKLNDKSPYEIFTLLYGKETATLLGIKEIPSDEITLKPSLFHKK